MTAPRTPLLEVDGLAVTLEASAVASGCLLARPQPG